MFAQFFRQFSSIHSTFHHLFILANELWILLVPINQNNNGLKAAGKYGIPCLESLEDLDHEVADGLDHLMVVVVERHLDVQTNKLRQVTMRVGVFRTEHCKTHAGFRAWRQN